MDREVVGPGNDLDRLVVGDDEVRPQPVAVSASTERDKPDLLGRLRRWVTPTNTDDDADEMELRYRHWSCCS